MPILERAGKKIALDEEGYLVRFEDWSEEVACALAEREGISTTCPLTEERMAILRFMRDYFKKFDAFPMIQKVCKNVGQPRSCAYDQFMDPLQAWKIAGLPKPTTEVFAYIKHRT